MPSAFGVRRGEAITVCERNQVLSAYPMFMDPYKIERLATSSERRRVQIRQASRLLYSFENVCLYMFILPLRTEFFFFFFPASSI